MTHEIPELKRGVCMSTTIIKNETFTRFSSYLKLLRSYCYIFRLLRKQEETCYNGKITTTELQDTENRIIKFLQSQEFQRELKLLRGNVELKEGKLKQKHPMLLPSRNYVTDLIIRHHHETNYHSGIQATFYSVRHRYCLLDGRNQVRKIVRKCVTCRRAKPVFSKYQMGNLPSVRVTKARPFLNVGIDYCDPFYVKERKYRNRNPPEKVYVFVCMVTKAIHLELVEDMTSASLIAALDRFVGRRGYPQRVYSDNGTNFVRANKGLREIFQLLHSEDHKNLIDRYAVAHNIEWSFNPPATSHFGELWEAGVKTFKHHLKRVTKNLSFTVIEFQTLTIKIEAVLNSCPLTPMSNDPNDLSCLTPGHFLIGESLTSLPEPSYTEIPTNRLSIWQHLTKLKQDFWNRWHKEYLNELNQRSKWKSGSEVVKIGMLVILKDEKLPPMRWSLGRIKSILMLTV